MAVARARWRWSVTPSGRSAATRSETHARYALCNWRDRKGAGLPVALGHLLADDRDHLLADLDGVSQEVVAARGQDLDAEVVVVEQRGGDRLGRTHERVRVAGAAGGGGGGRPQRPVVALAPLGQGDEALGAGVLRRAARPAAEG